MLISVHGSTLFRQPKDGTWLVRATWLVAILMSDTVMTCVANCNESQAGGACSFEFCSWANWASSLRLRHTPLPSFAPFACKAPMHSPPGTRCS